MLSEQLGSFGDAIDGVFDSGYGVDLEWVSNARASGPGGRRSAARDGDERSFGEGAPDMVVTQIPSFLSSGIIAGWNASPRTSPFGPWPIYVKCGYFRLIKNRTPGQKRY